MFSMSQAHRERRNKRRASLVRKYYSVSTKKLNPSFCFGVSDKMD